MFLKQSLPKSWQAPSRATAARFAAVGVLGTLLDIGLFALLHTWLGVAVVVANILSYGAGIVNNYLWHRFWTYGRVASAAPVAGQFARFLVVSLSALALNTLIVFLLAPLLGALPAKLLATGVGLGWNFLANHYWTFRPSASLGASL
ncbi:MAG: GtrA family protein [Oscillochloris sp.]|nr:GtrA family protein [Oscillochloris sp.]